MTLVEVMVAVLVLAVILLAAGHATASALRLGHRGLLEARLAAALGAEAALLDAAAHAGLACSTLTFGRRREGELSVRWRAMAPAQPGVVLLEAESGAGPRRVADAVTLVLACQ